MTPPPVGVPSQTLAALTESAAQKVHAQVGRMLHQIGRPLARTAHLARSKAPAQVALRSLLISDLYGTDDASARSDEAPAQRFAQLLIELQTVWPAVADDPRMAGVAAQLSAIAQLETALRKGDELATGQALAAAMSVELLLLELLAEIEAQHPITRHG